MRWDCTADDVDDPTLRQVLAYWRSKASEGRLPARSDIDPADLRAALGSLLLIEVHRPGPRFRYRLVGTRIVDHGGIDPTGRFVDEFPWPEYRAMVLERLAGLLDRGRPLHVRRVGVLDGRHFDYRMLWLPLAGDGRTIDMLLGCQIFRERQP
jgi:hypothetical protein